MLITEGDLDWPLTPATKPSGFNPPPSDDQWQQASDAATEWLWAMSGRIFGTRACVYRPQGLWVNRVAWYSRIPYLQSIYGPLWGECRGDQLPRQVLQLPGPAVSVQSVTLVDGDGVSSVLDPADYRLDGDYLVRVDGDTWPTTQDLIADMGVANTWSISYTRGREVPMGGQIAAAQLAAEWLKAILGMKDCKLPWNTTTAARSGVTVALALASAYRTSGIAAVDRWVTMVNPAGLVQPPRIWSPDIARNSNPYRGSFAPYRPTS